MKKVLLSIMCVLLIMMCVTGCKKSKSKTTLDDVTLTKGKSTSICKETETGDDYDMTTTTTTNYDDNGYAINMKVISEYLFYDGEQFEIFVEETEKNTEANKNMEGIDYDYSIDKEKRVLKTLFAYRNLKLDDNIREAYSIKELVKSSESRNGKCELKGTTRDAIGL